MENKLREWLEKTGYPLEISALDILNKKNYKSSPSSLYQDYETNKIREIDIVAYKTIESEGINVEIKFIIECKKSNKPFILLTPNNDVESISRVLINLDIDHPATHSIIDALTSSKKFKESIKKSSQSYPIGNKMIQGFAESDDTIYTAINSIAKSFKYFLESEKIIYDNCMEDNYYCLSIPVLLIDAPFYKIFLENNSLQLEKIQNSLMSIKKPWEFEIDSNYYIPVVTYDYFSEFINQVDKLAEFYLEHIKSMPIEYQIKNIFLNRYKV